LRIFLADGNPIVSMRRMGAKPIHFHLDERLKANASSSWNFQCVCQSSERRHYVSLIEAVQIRSSNPRRDHEEERVIRVVDTVVLSN
jgi:hypothetical protein